MHCDLKIYYSPPFSSWGNSVSVLQSKSRKWIGSSQGARFPPDLIQTFYPSKESNHIHVLEDGTRHPPTFGVRGLREVLFEKNSVHNFYIVDIQYWLRKCYFRLWFYNSFYPIFIRKSVYCWGRLLPYVVDFMFSLLDVIFWDNFSQIKLYNKTIRYPFGIHTRHLAAYQCILLHIKHFLIK